MSEAYRPHVVVPTGGGARHVIEGATITVKTTGADTDGAWSLVEYTLPPYAQGTPAHWHADTVEAMYVLDGLLALTLDDATITAGRGAMILVPAGVRHTFYNPTATPVTLLAWFCPGGCEGYWTELSALQATLGAGSDQAVIPPDQLAMLWHKYDQHYPAA